MLLQLVLAQLLLIWGFFLGCGICGSKKLSLICLCTRVISVDRNTNLVDFEPNRVLWNWQRVSHRSESSSSYAPFLPVLDCVFEDGFIDYARLSKRLISHVDEPRRKSALLTSASDHHLVIV